MTESNSTESVYYALPVEGETNFNFTKGPNVGIPQVVAANDSSTENTQNTRMLIAAQAVYFPEKKITEVTSAVLHYQLNHTRSPWTIVGEISNSFPLKFDTSYSVGTLQLCATKDFTFLYFFSPWVEGRLYFIKNEGLLENKERCWFPVELPAHFQFNASLELKGHLISGSYKSNPLSSFERSYIDLNDAIENKAEPECCAPYTIKRANVDDEGIKLGVSQTQVSSKTEHSKKDHTIEVTVHYNTLGYKISQSDDLYTENGDVNPGQHYSITMPTGYILQGTHLKTGKPHTFTDKELKNFVPKKDTYRLNVPTCTILPNNLPTTNKIFTLCHDKTIFMITMENAICSFWRFKNSKLEEFFEKTYNATQEQSIHNLHYAGQTIIDVMSHPHIHNEYYVLFEQKNNSLYNTYTAVKITWGPDKKNIEQLKKLKVNQTEISFAFLQHHENPFFDQKQDEICIGVFTNNFGRVTCTCAGDGETELRSIFCFCNQPLNQTQYENAFLNINCDDMLINEAIFSLPTSF